MDYKSLITRELYSEASKLLMTKPIERVCKKLDVSVQVRELGNKAFRSKGHDAEHHERILHCYSTSLAFAPSNSEHLAFAYANKSALLLHLGKFEESIKDIDRALKLAITPNTLRVKLLCRKLECFVHIDEFEGSREILEEIDRYMGMIDEENRKALEKVVGRVKVLLGKGEVEVANFNFSEGSETEHLRLRAAKESKGIFDSISLAHNAKYGHHLIATQDIQPGQLVFVSKPYTAVANFKQFQSYCAHCVNVLWSSVPCENCGFSLYCSEQCRDEANKSYHELECRCLQFILCDNLLDNQVHVALRCVIKAVKEFRSIDALVEMVRDVDKLSNNDAKGFENSGEFRSDSFRSLLKFTDLNVGPTVLEHLVAASCRSVIALARYTSFFGEAQQFNKTKDLLDNKDVIFIASLLLRISLVVFKNGKKIVEENTPCKNSKDQVTCSTSLPCCERGYSIDMMRSFVPHSCNPNVRSVIIEGGKELWYALQPITKGQPLLDCYKIAFFELDKLKRSSIISQVINRDCNCAACEKNWPPVLAPDGLMMTNHDMLRAMVDGIKNHKVCWEFPIMMKENEQYTQATVDALTEIMNKMFEIENQPSKLLCSMICILRFVFDRLHGIKFCIPSKCRILQS